jgi:hypothetical protein
MNRRVDELLREKFTLDPPELLCSVQGIDLKLQSGQPFKDSFRIGTAEGIKLYGDVYSDNHRIVFAADSFSGASCTIVYGIDISGLEEGAHISGSISVVTNIGELRIPVEAKIEDVLPQPYEEAKNLEKFAQTASADFREAFRMFTNENFKKILRGKNSQYIPLYKGLSQNPVTYQHLEEFLIAVGKKEAVRLSVDKQDKISYVLNNSIKDTLYIYKSTWGYTRIEVETNGGFIGIEKKLITSDDFIGRVYGLEFILDREKLHGRRCFGSIVLKTVYETIEIQIEASPYEDMEIVSTRFRQERILRLFREFLALNLKKMDYRTWYDNAKLWVEEIKEEQEDLLTLFAEGYLAYCQEERAKLAELLWPIKTGEIKLGKPWEKAVYLFLAKEAGIIPEESSDIAPRLYMYHQQDPSNYLILALYFNELPEETYNSSKSLSELEKIYDLGCRSPFLFLRAWKLLDSQESRLRRLTPFMIRVLCFAQKEGLISESLLTRAAFLTSNVKGFRPALYKLLSAGYEKYGKREILEAVCRHIMNDDPSDPGYYKWYKKAVEENIRLTRLYEYYIETRPETFDEPLPMPVKLYFSYTMSIGERKKAFLYASIIRDKENDPVTYENYKQTARNFAYNSLRQGKINEFYAILYKEFFEDCEDAETAGYLAGVLFSHKLVCSRPDMRNVIVCHMALNDMQSYSLNDGKAYPKIYSKDVCIFFEDEKKRRFAATVDYELKPLLDIEKISKTCMLFGAWDIGMQLYCCHERTWQTDISRHNILSFWKAAENIYLTREYRDKTRKKLLNYFIKNTDDWGLQPYVESIKELTYGRVDKEKTFDLLISYGQYGKAFNLVSHMGYEGISCPALMKLAIAKIKQAGTEKDTEVVSLAFHVYRNGCFNDDILEYISVHGVFDIESCEELWKKMSGFSMDTYNVEEKYLLLSMLVVKTTPCCEKILDNYIKKGGKPSIYKAYLNFLSLLYAVKDRKIADKTAWNIEKLCVIAPKESIIRDIAWTKYKAAEGGVTQAQTETLKKIIDFCVSSGLRFSFFKKLPKEITGLCELDDKVFAEESFPSGSDVTIHYRIDRDASGDAQYKSEPFKESIPGLFVREFLLFYGEDLSYYCTVMTPDGPRDTEVKKLKTEESSTRGRSKYQLLNRMLMLKKLRAYEKADKAMEQYLKQEAFVDNTFKIKE